MADIRYRVPYQVDIFAREEITDQLILNTFYFRSAFATTGSPTYGDPLAGPATTAAFLTNLNVAWLSGPWLAASEHAFHVKIRVRSIVGWAYPTPFKYITNVVGGAPAVITTSTPHGFSNLSTVRISGVTTPTGTNGSWSVNVLDAYRFELTGSTISGAYTGSGLAQLQQGAVTLLYEDNDELDDDQAGAITGEMLPPYVSADVRRVNPGTGRNYRSRIGFGPLGESQQSGGVLTGGAVTSISSTLTAFTAVENGGTDATAKFMYSYALSKARAFQATTPFFQGDSFTKPVTSCICKPNLGSQNSRKARNAA